MSSQLQLNSVAPGQKLTLSSTKANSSMLSDRTDPLSSSMKLNIPPSILDMQPMSLSSSTLGPVTTNHNDIDVQFNDIDPLSQTMPVNMLSQQNYYQTNTSSARSPRNPFLFMEEAPSSKSKSDRSQQEPGSSSGAGHHHNHHHHHSSSSNHIPHPNKSSNLLSSSNLQSSNSRLLSGNGTLSQNLRREREAAAQQQNQQSQQLGQSNSSQNNSLSQQNLDSLAENGFNPVDTLMRCKSTIKNLNSELHKEREENRNLRNKLGQQQSEVAMKDSKVTELQQALATIGNQRDQLKTVQEEDSSNLEQTRSELSETAKKLLNTTNERTLLNQEKVDLEVQLKVFKDKVETCESQRAMLEHVKERLSADIEYLEERSKRYEETMGPLIEKQKSMISTLEERCESGEKRVEELREQNLEDSNRLKDACDREMRSLEEQWKSKFDAHEKDWETERQMLISDRDAKIKDLSDKFSDLELARLRQVEVLDGKNRELQIQNKDLREALDRENGLREDSQRNLESTEKLLTHAEEQLNFKSQKLEKTQVELEKCMLEKKECETNITHLKENIEQKEELIDTLKNELSDSKEKIELLQKLSKKRENSLRKALDEYRKEVSRLSESLNRAEEKLKEYRHMGYENHKLHSHVKELTMLFDRVRKDSQGKYESIIEKLNRQNKELKNESVSLAQSLNRTLESQYRNVGVKYDSLAERYRRTPKYQNDNFPPGRGRRFYEAPEEEY